MKLKKDKNYIALAPYGLGSVLNQELRLRGVIVPDTRIFTKRLRSHDFLLFRGVPSEHLPLRVPELVLECPVFGRFKISKSLLDQVCEAIRIRTVESVKIAIECAGKQFSRQDLTRFLVRELSARDINLVEQDEQGPGPTIILYVYTIDELFYFGLEPVSDTSWTVRSPVRKEREGSLPREIAAAMTILVGIKSKDQVWDPVCGSGGLLREVAETLPADQIHGSDLDPAAVKICRENLPSVDVVIEDSRQTRLASQSVDVVVANLPFGKKFGSVNENKDLYSKILAEAVRVSKKGSLRCVMVTSDTQNLAEAARALALPPKRELKVKVKGLAASIFLF